MMLFLVLAALFTVGEANQCYEFRGTPNAYVSFTTELLNLNDSLNIQLQFSTSASEGIIFYLAGPHDTESLFIKEGKLHYFLWNQFANGTGSSFGARRVSEDRVDDGNWHMVRFYRNAYYGTSDQRDTGMTLDGVNYKDSLVRQEVKLNQPIYFGGYQHSSKVQNFNGRIRNIREVEQAFRFNHPTDPGQAIRTPQC